MNTLLVLLSLPLLAISGPIFPLPDGFPWPDTSQLQIIEQQASGTLSNSSLPGNISMEGLKDFQLIAFNELAEVAFFTELLSNITNNVEGYMINAEKRDFIISTITAVQRVCYSLE